VISLNLGLWCEQINRLDCARSAYLSYLGAYSDRSEDAFWQETEFRRSLVQRFLPAGAGYYGLTTRAGMRWTAATLRRRSSVFKAALAQEPVGAPRPWRA